MSFQKWIQEAEREYYKALDRKFKSGKLMPNTYPDRIIQYYLTYKQWQLTKWLVIATWILVIATIILTFIK